MLGGARRTVPLAAVAVLLAVAGCGLAPRQGAPKAPVSRPAELAATTPVTVHGRALATRCAGDPSKPAVVLLSGYNTPLAAEWDAVQGRIGEVARVCAYDRPGVGGSDKPPRRQTFVTLAADLDALLRALDLRRPVVLVGHSIGGVLAVTWAAEHPRDVAGVVLLDAVPPGYSETLLQDLPADGTGPAATRRHQWSWLMDAGRNREHLDARDGFDSLLTLPALGTVPVVALTHSISALGDGLRPRYAAALDSAWTGGQQAFSRLSHVSRVQVVDRAGYWIQRDQPQVVVDAVTSVLAGSTGA